MIYPADLNKILVLTCALMISACSFAPDYAAPEITVPTNYKEVGDWLSASPADMEPKGTWWLAFGDVKLNELENDVTTANQNLKIAIAQYDEARALANLARSDYFPTVTTSTGYSFNHLSKNSANGGGNKQFSDYTLGADLSYEIDVWGRVRNAIAAGLDQAQANAADLASIDLSLHAELAIDYIMLRGDDASQVILDQTVDIDQKAYDLVKRRFDGGVSPEVDLDQAQIQLQNATTQASDMRLHRSQLEHAIAVLTGRVPAAFQLPSVPLGPVAPPSVTLDMPSTLLQRRPDVAAAERRVAAANAEIGVARAAFYPSFSLTAMLGLESANPARWLSAPSVFWGLGPSSVLPLLDGGKREALNDQARAQYDENVGAYRQTVLSSYQQVEDSLSAIHHLRDQTVTQSAAVTASQKALRQENYLYKGGATIYINVATSENAALQANLSLINVRVRHFIATVQLFKALGGGWDYQKAFAQSPADIPATTYVVEPALVPAVEPAQTRIPATSSAGVNFNKPAVQPAESPAMDMSPATNLPASTQPILSSPAVAPAADMPAAEPALSQPAPETKTPSTSGFLNIVPDYPHALDYPG